LKKKNKTPLPLRIVQLVFPWVEKFFPALANRFFIYLFFTPFRYKIPESELLIQQTATLFTVTLDGKKIQCYTWGHGPAVLLLHGWAGRALQLMKFIEPLTQAGFSVVAMDGPAHGRSEGKKTNLDEFKYAIGLVAEKCGGLKAIIAHSFGGVASLYAIAEGLPVNTLVNIASPTLGDEIIRTYLRAIKGSWKTGEAFKRFVLEKTGKPFESFTAMEFIKRVPNDFKLLLVHDEGDTDVIWKQPEALLNVYPRAELVKTKGLGHTRILKDDQVIRQVVTFIMRHSSKT
jgi:hypothetical protein